MLHSLQPQHFVIPRYLRTRSECPECKDRFIYGEGVMSLAHFRVTDTGEAGPGVLLLHHCFVRSTRRYWGSCIERERGSHWSGVRCACRLRGRRAPRCDLRFSMLKRPGIDQPPADRRAGILHNQDPAAGLGVARALEMGVGWWSIMSGQDGNLDLGPNPSLIGGEGARANVALMSWIGNGVRQ